MEYAIIIPVTTVYRTSEKLHDSLSGSIKQNFGISSMTSTASKPAKDSFREVLPKRGLLFAEDQPQMVLCKPKLLPLKSVTLEKLEKMQNEAKEKAKEQLLEQQREQEEDERRAKEGNVVSESVSFE